MAEKIRILLLKKKMSVTDLAKLLDMTPQNLSNKFKRDNFSEKELKQIANALKIDLEMNFILEDGTKI